MCRVQGAERFRVEGWPWTPMTVIAHPKIYFHSFYHARLAATGAAAGAAAGARARALGAAAASLADRGFGAVVVAVVPLPRLAGGGWRVGESGTPATSLRPTARRLEVPPSPVVARAVRAGPRLLEVFDTSPEIAAGAVAGAGAAARDARGRFGGGAASVGDFTTSFRVDARRRGLSAGRVVAATSRGADAGDRRRESIALQLSEV